jgi:predicted transposase/invertase (TIGR01784 family)
MPLPASRQITEIEYLQPEQVPDIPGKKNSIVDVKCKDKRNGFFIIEMQMWWTSDFMKRLLFNASKAIVRQLDKKGKYNRLKPVYTLAILNDNYTKKTEQCYHHYNLVNLKNTEEKIKGLEFVLVELPKFRPENWSDRKITSLWLRFLKEVNEDMSELPLELAENEHIRQAAELCEEGAYTQAELDAYDKYWDIVRTEKTLMYGKFKEGRAEGRAEGEAERSQLKAKLEDAQAKLINSVLNCHREGLSVKAIATITEFTVNEIEIILKKYYTD